MQKIAVLFVTLGFAGLGVGSIDPPKLAIKASPQQGPRLDLHSDPLPPGAMARIGTVRWRHGGAVFFVGLVAKGNELLTVSQDGWIRILDAQTGKELRRLGKPGKADSGGASESRYYFGAPAAVALSADGRFVAIKGNFEPARLNEPEVLRVWDVATGKELWQQLWEDPNSGLAFSPDGEVLVAQGRLGIRQWEAATGKEAKRLPPLLDSGLGRTVSEAHQFAFSPDGKILAGIVVDKAGDQVINVIKLWDLTTGEVLHRIKGNHGDFTCLAFSPDGKYLAFPHPSEATISLWEMGAGKEIRRFKGETDKEFLYGLAFSPDGKLLASRSTSRVLRLWDVNIGKELRPLEGPRDSSGASTTYTGHPGGAAPILVFSHDSKVLLAGSDRYLVRRWNVATGKELFSGGPIDHVSDAVFSPDGKTLTTCAGNIVRQWDPWTGKEIRPVALPQDAVLLTFSPARHSVAFAAGQHLHVWDLSKLQELCKWKLPGSEFKEFNTTWLYQMRFAADGKFLAAKNYDHLLHIWNTETGKETFTQPEPKAPSDPLNKSSFSESHFALSPDGKLLVRMGTTWLHQKPLASSSAPRSSTIRCYDVARGNLVREFMLKEGVTGCAFSPNGHCIALAHGLHVAVYEIATGQVRCQFPGFVRGPAFSPDGRTLAAGRGATLKLWNMVNGKLLTEFTGHLAPIRTVGFAPDGKSVATGSSDTTVLVWDIAAAIESGRPPALKLTAEQMETLWRDLDADAATAYAAMQKLAASGRQGAEELKKRLPPTPEIPAERLAGLIGDLGHDKFTIRQKATKELELLGDLAEPAMQARIAKGGVSLEVRQRIEQILHKVNLYNVAVLRPLRAIETLEWINLPEARQVLEGLAQGAEGAQQTRAARAAVMRWAQSK